MSEIVIGRGTADHLLVRVLDRSHPASTDYWDGNWIRSLVVVRVGPFEGEYRCELRTDELSRLHDDLARLYGQLGGRAGLATLDGYLGFDVEGDGLGHFTIEGEATDDPGAGRSLSFRLEIDQTQLAEVVGQLEATVRQFPVLGSPDG